TETVSVPVLRWQDHTDRVQWFGDRKGETEGEMGGEAGGKGRVSVPMPRWQVAGGRCKLTIGPKGWSIRYASGATPESGAGSVTGGETPSYKGVGESVGGEMGGCVTGDIKEEEVNPDAEESVGESDVEMECDDGRDVQGSDEDDVTVSGVDTAHVVLRQETDEESEGTEVLSDRESEGEITDGEGQGESGGGENHCEYTDTEGETEGEAGGETEGEQSVSSRDDTGGEVSEEETEGSVDEQSETEEESWSPVTFASLSLADMESVEDLLCQVRDFDVSRLEGACAGYKQYLAVAEELLSSNQYLTDAIAHYSTHEMDANSATAGEYDHCTIANIYAFQKRERMDLTDLEHTLDMSFQECVDEVTRADQLLREIARVRYIPPPADPLSLSLWEQRQFTRVHGYDSLVLSLFEEGDNLLDCKAMVDGCMSLRSDEDVQAMLDTRVVGVESCAGLAARTRGLLDQLEAVAPTRVRASLRTRRRVMVRRIPKRLSLPSCLRVTG
ncbi:hypothetical protein KIPB_006681, partial [Kipferlia bialata]